MLTKLHLKNFKGFRDTEIPELRKVNLILGGQNVGKTSLLEAILFLRAELTESGSTLDLLPSKFRANEGEDARRFWALLLGTQDQPTTLLVMARISNMDIAMGGIHHRKTALYIEKYWNAFSENATGKISKAFTFNLKEFGSVDLFTGFNPGNLSVSQSFNLQSNLRLSEPYTASIFSTGAVSQVKLYGQLVVKKKKTRVLNLLQQIEPRISSIDAIAPDGEHRIYIDLNGGEVLPIGQLGHGFTRLFELYSGLAVTDSKLALIDEIENGIHYSALPTVFQGIRELAESNGVQSIITTHSLEAIKAACEVFKDKPEDFQLIRLERTNDDNIRAVAINDENLKTVMASGWEIR